MLGVAMEDGCSRQSMRYWMGEMWREPSNDSGDTSVTTLVSFVNSKEQISIPLQLSWCQVVVNVPAFFFY
jgi:hypothetical protein